MEVTKYIDGLYGVKTQLNIPLIKQSCYEMYEIVEHCFQDKDDQKSLITDLYSKYNLLLFPLPGIHELYWSISNTFHYCLSDDSGLVKEKFVVQCWLNFFKEGEFIDWHSHWSNRQNCWHGFLCVDTEPDSFTSYRWNDDTSRKDVQIDVPSKDGLMVIGKSNNDVHKSSEWKVKDRPRITIAFDIAPCSTIYSVLTKELPGKTYLSAAMNNIGFVNHWIPI